jgi:predicted O-methyltransferase YrrM
MDITFWQKTEREEIYRQAATDENREFVLEVMRTLQPDPIWTAPIIEMIESKQIETRCFISWLANELQPKIYLEVGVRLGFSMAMVAARSPETEIYGFDMWIKNYADVPNPGQNFVRSELEKVGYNKKIHLIDGDSHQTLPAFFGNKGAKLRDRLKLGWKMKSKPKHFDLITIDGDHSLLGAHQDLLDTMPHCSVGGVVVFDDILPGSLGESENGNDPHDWKNLLGVWHAVQEKFPNFLYFEFLENIPGVGLAVRMK